MNRLSGRVHFILAIDELLKIEGKYNCFIQHDQGWSDGQKKWNAVSTALDELVAHFYQHQFFFEIVSSSKTYPLEKIVAGMLSIYPMQP